MGRRVVFNGLSHESMNVGATFLPGDTEARSAKAPIPMAQTSESPELSADLS